MVTAGLRLSLKANVLDHDSAMFMIRSFYMVFYIFEEGDLFCKPDVMPRAPTLKATIFIFSCAFLAFTSV